MGRGLIPLLLGFLGLIPALHAADADSTGSKFSFHGYATLGLVHSNEEQADFLGSLLLDHGAGYSESCSAEVDSRIGVQLNASFTPKLSAVVQVLAEQQASGTFEPHLEWANVKYQLTPEASVRLGRIVVPSFMVSDYRKVGYANAWVRPPVEVYGLVPVTASDGIDVSYQWNRGQYTQRVQASFGAADVELPQDDTAKARSLWGVTSTTERGAGSFHIAYQQARLTIESFNNLFDAFRPFGSAGEAIAERWDADGTLYRFASVGALYDPGGWFAMAEWGTTDTHSAIGDRTAWHVSGGYRFRDLTPYLTYSTVKADAPTSDPGLDAALYPPELTAQVAALDDALNLILASNPIQSTVTLGLRWDLRQNLDLKVQLDRSRLGAGSHGSLRNLQPEFRPGGSYNLISVAIDVLF